MNRSNNDQSWKNQYQYGSLDDHVTSRVPSPPPPPSSSTTSYEMSGKSADTSSHIHMKRNASSLRDIHRDQPLKNEIIETRVSIVTSKGTFLRDFAIQASLVVNIIILLVKIVAYAKTMSLSVLAALVDSLLDVTSQVILYLAERHAKAAHSSALYPAGASRMEPIGVLVCAALMGIASFEVIQDSIKTLIGHQSIDMETVQFGSMISMLSIVTVKVALLKLCNHASDFYGSIVTDSTLDALALDHLNDALSNFVAAVALTAVYISKRLWLFDPLGAIAISFYIIYSWFSTGREMVEQLIGKAAPKEFIEELVDLASTHDSRMTVDVCRAYHFGPKFLVEFEVVLPADMPLIQSHDIGMDLQYQIEGLDEVERCFVHIDYEKRDYDEHAISKSPQLREKYTKRSSGSPDGNGCFRSNDAIDPNLV